MKNFIKKISALFLIFSLLFSSSYSIASADFDWPAPPDAASQMIDGMLEKYGLKPEQLAEKAQMLNNISLKTKGPEMEVSFQPTNPNPGEKVTATAMPKNFGNDPKSMYYTWYLKHEGEENSTENLELFKQRAMRIIASAGFEGGDYTDSPSDNDNDGYQAYFGGDDQRNVGEDEHCFFYDTKKGAKYEFRECRHLFPNAGDDDFDEDGGGLTTGDGEFKTREEEFWQTDPEDDDTADIGQVDEATIAGLGQMTFTWTYQRGDQVGVVIEGAFYEPTLYEDASYQVMWALPKNTCDLPDRDEDGDSDEVFDDPSDVAVDSIEIDPSTWPDCTDGCTFTRTITSSSTSYKKSPFSSYQIGTSTKTVRTQQIHLNPPLPYIGGEFSATATGGTGGTTETGGEGGTAETSGEIGTEYFPPELPGGSPEEDICLAVDFPGVELTQEDKDSIVDRSCCPAGDGEVGAEGLCEDVCTDINEDGDTEDEGECESVCQAATWSDYCTVLSDRTETTNNQTTVEPGKAKPLRCEDLNEDGDTEDEGECEEDDADVDASAVSLFNMTMGEFNECLLFNFVDPTEGGYNKKTEVDLSYYPKNPINDPGGENSDELAIGASIIGANDEEFLYYKWEVYSTDDEEMTDETDWGNPLTKDELVESTPLLGLGANNLKFKLALENATYLKIKLVVSEKAYNGEKKGRGEVFIPLTKNQENITASIADVSLIGGDTAGSLSASSMGLSSVKLSPGSKVVSKDSLSALGDSSGDATDPIVIDVARNQIVALEIPETDPPIDSAMWTVDGKTISGKYPQEDDALPEVAYFPVTQQIGETFNASLIATKEDGTKMNLTKAFRVVDPKATITSTNEGSCVPKLKGYYIDTDEVEWPDYADKDFQALAGSIISLQATFDANLEPDPENIVWIVDGEKIGTGNSITFDAGESGESHSVSVQTLYSQDNPTAKALDDYWDISYDGLYETNVSDSISIDVVDTMGGYEDAKGKTKLFLASLSAGFSTYLLFLFRLILTTGLILFLFKTVLSISKKNQEPDVI